MAQETRKDPRAKVLSMTVRYKSATLDEFIEQHSHDVSRGGMFIKTPSPFPAGTLLKFEVKIAEDQKVMNGVGRVVWKREPAESANDRPAGMGVKFIKIDEPARKLIDRLIDQRGDTVAAFEAGEIAAAPAPAARAPAAVAAASPPRAAAPVSASSPSPPRIGTPAGGLPLTVATAPAAVAAAARPVRKATMMGLGALDTGPASGPQKNDSEPPIEENFFPKTDSLEEMRPPEDRTVMKQAAELLQDALREAGGSMDEVGEAGKPPAQPDLPAEEDWLDNRPTEKAPPPAASSALAELYAADKAASEKRADEPKLDRVEERPEREPIKKEEPVRRPAVKSAAPAAEVKPPAGSVEAAFAEQKSRGGGLAVLLLLLVAGAAALIFFLTKKPKEEVVEPAPVASPPAVVKEPEPVPEPKVEEPPPVVDAAVAAPPPEPPKVEEPPPEEKKVAPPRPRPRKPKPKPPAETEPTDSPPADTQPKETQPKETQPKETQPKETQPKETQPPADDNPY